MNRRFSYWSVTKAKVKVKLDGRVVGVIKSVANGPVNGWQYSTGKHRGKIFATYNEVVRDVEGTEENARDLALKAIKAGLTMGQFVRGVPDLNVMAKEEIQVYTKAYAAVREELLRQNP